jgi:chromosome segregation ATPase
MKKELIDAERREQDLEEQLEVAEAEVSNLRDTVDELESNLGNNSATIMMLREELELAEADKDQLRDVVASKETMLDQVSAELAKLKSRMSNQTEDMESIERETQNKIAHVKEDYELKLEKLRAQFQEKRAQCEYMSKRSEKLDNQLTQVHEILKQAHTSSEQELSRVS